MILSDTEILAAMKDGDIEITNFKRENLGPNSYDFTLNPLARFFTGLARFAGYGSSSTFNPITDIPSSYEAQLPAHLEPHETCTVMSNEILGIKQKYVGLLTRRTTLSRIPLLIQYSHLVDTGYRGIIGAGITNLSESRITVVANMRFLQVMFARTGQVEQGYQDRPLSKGIGQDGTFVPQYKIDKEFLLK
jgi:deoxycytidine triphosphate deaminase